jgi:hypothetical protein
MPKLRQRKFLAQEKDFLAFPDHYVSLPGTIAFAELTKLKATGVADIYGDNRVVIPRGTVVHMDADGKVTAPVAGSETVTAVKPNAILFDTIYVDMYDSGTDTAVNAAVLVHGYVRKDRLYGDKDNLENAQIYVVNK